MSDVTKTPVDPDEVVKAAAEMIKDQSRVKVGLTSGQRRALGIKSPKPKYSLKIKAAR